MVVVRQWLVLALLLALAAGCRPPASNDGAGGAGRGRTGGLRIAVIPKGTTVEFWKSVHYGADQAAKELGVQIYWKGPLLENDREGQISVVQDFIAQRVDGICLAPLDSQALIAPVQQARDAGIPVVIFDSGLADESLIVSYVATDNFHGGELAAEEMARRLHGRGDVILLRYSPGSQSTERREEGFLKRIADFPGVRVISSQEYSGTAPESALDKAQQLISTYRGRFDGIFSVCEPNAMGVFGALQEAGLLGKVVFIGFDPSPRMVQALAEGKMHGIVLQDPVKIGRLAVKTMVDHLQGRPVPKRIATGEHVATPENLRDPEIDRLLHPPMFE